MSEARAGWYPHPGHVGTEQYWDGAAWTAQKRPAAAHAQPAAAVIPTASHPARPRAAWLMATVVPMVVVIAVGCLLILWQGPSAQASVTKALSAT